ncbi:hypothetical protein [Clostridium fungisolvens]|uniref:Uncharacterized protein n=1 Tax=Clostridium fungisolvens TaxID=1604897 RepID=A0A6V8SF12_9CLOT|nr:hypothetical protein [Clostridium fungisolvens]GFP75787.1 hypothetical protein bsdtw1_01879 [Clostridium fungisolvens]
MDVSSIMSTYNMSSLWNSINSSDSMYESSSMLISNVDSAVKGNYEESTYSGKSPTSQLDDLYKKVEPTYGIPLSYDSSGNLSIPTDTNSLNNIPADTNSNILPLLETGDSTSELSTINILNQYNGIENGTYTSNTSTILSSNPYNLYSNIESLSNNKGQGSGNNFDFSV